MAFRDAFKDLVIATLRELAKKKGTTTYRLVSETLEKDEHNKFNYRENEYGDALYDHAITSKGNQGQGCYGSAEDVLLYAYAYMPMHLQVFKSAVCHRGVDDAEELRTCLNEASGDLLFVDIGCGPLTAGVAIADWYQKVHGEALELTYIAIDQSKYCLDLAKKFASRSDLFRIKEEFLAYNDTEECDAEELASRVTEDGTVVFLLSYLFGQQTCSVDDLRKLAEFILKVARACAPTRCFVVYTNSTHGGTSKYNAFMAALSIEENSNAKGYYADVYRKFMHKDGGGMETLKGKSEFRHIVFEITPDEGE